MRRTRIKICGVRHPEDAALAGEAGADAVGVILHAIGAKRLADVDAARRIFAAVPPFVSRVGVFVDGGSRVRLLADSLGIDVVQLHGRETPDQAVALMPRRIVKVLRLDEGFGLSGWSKPRNVVALTLDSGAGSGHENDWDAVERALANGEPRPPIILAGGLTPWNVGDVVRRFRPWAVDVSSGVEEDDGRKDPKLVEAFIKAVQRADDAT